jgi:hypothetical protein
VSCHQRDEIVALVFEVESLDRVTRHLKSQALLGDATINGVAILPRKTAGLRIYLQQSAMP